MYNTMITRSPRNKWYKKALNRALTTCFCQKKNATLKYKLTNRTLAAFEYKKYQKVNAVLKTATVVAHITKREDPHRSEQNLFNHFSSS